MEFISSRTLHRANVENCAHEEQVSDRFDPLRRSGHRGLTHDTLSICKTENSGF